MVNPRGTFSKEYLYTLCISVRTYTYLSHWYVRRNIRLHYGILFRYGRRKLDTVKTSVSRFNRYRVMLFSATWKYNFPSLLYFPDSGYVHCASIIEKYIAAVLCLTLSIRWLKFCISLKIPTTRLDDIATGSILNPLAGKFSEDTRKKGNGAKTGASHDWRSFYLSQYDWLKANHMTKVVWLPNETDYSYYEFVVPNTRYSSTKCSRLQ